VSRPSAPPPLDLVQAFVNTLDVESGHDELADAEALARWLADRGLLPGAERLGASELERAVAGRESLRAMLRANHDRRPAPAGALAQLNALAAAVPHRLRFIADGAWEIVPAGTGFDHALATVLGAVATGMADGTWARLKVCAEDTCQWSFYDTSRNRSGKWCSMAVCGNRTKVRAFRERHGAV
jgi:predicted RNA-binding Zn ribbon-like protein